MKLLMKICFEETGFFKHRFFNTILFLHTISCQEDVHCAVACNYFPPRKRMKKAIVHNFT